VSGWAQMMPASGSPTILHRWWHSRFGAELGRELALVLGLLLFYKYGRSIVRHESDIATRHARQLVSLERDLRIFSEARLQEAFLGAGTAFEWFLNAYYLFAHVVVTAIAFFWLYARHPSTYVRFRRVMIAMTLIGLAMHVLYPLAPPRMFPHLGFVDIGRSVGPASYGSGSPYGGFANQFAAMPSLHFGWALAIAWAAVAATRSRWRWIVVTHPVITLAAIVLTANHYWLDAAIAALLFAIALVFDRWRVSRNRRADRGRHRESATTHGFQGSPIHT